MQTKRLTPKETVHAWCHYCIQSRSDADVQNCGGQLVYATGKPCPFFPFRMGKRPPTKVFRQFCLECMGGSSLLVRECAKDDCPMHPYRFGKNPFIRGGSKDQMNAIRSPGTLFSPAKMN
ncbi:MAG TPA: hypothetical protein PK575_13935 [Syntrophorhabdus sp.]|nr:hypothetical protein [Syntrophorhabdus sp.]